MEILNVISVLLEVIAMLAFTYLLIAGGLFLTMASFMMLRWSIVFKYLTELKRS